MTLLFDSFESINQVTARDRTWHCSQFPLDPIRPYLSSPASGPKTMSAGASGWLAIGQPEVEVGAAARRRGRGRPRPHARTRPAGPRAPRSTRSGSRRGTRDPIELPRLTPLLVAAAGRPPERGEESPGMRSPSSTWVSSSSAGLDVAVVAGRPLERESALVAPAAHAQQPTGREQAQGGVVEHRVVLELARGPQGGAAGSQRGPAPPSRASTGILISRCSSRRLHAASIGACDLSSSAPPATSTMARRRSSGR